MIYKASNDDPGGLHESQRGAGLPLASLGVVNVGSWAIFSPRAMEVSVEQDRGICGKTCGTP